MLDGCPNGCGLKRDFFEGFDVGEKTAHRITEEQFDLALARLSMQTDPGNLRTLVILVAQALDFDTSEVSDV